MCHINMLKLYKSRLTERCDENSSAVPVLAVTSYIHEEDGLNLHDNIGFEVRLQNSKVLKELNDFLSYLADICHKDIKELIQSC